jgi:hypothetical protein
MPAHELDEVYGMLLDQDHGILSLVGLHAQHPDPGPRILRPTLAGSTSTPTARSSSFVGLHHGIPHLFTVPL